MFSCMSEFRMLCSLVMKISTVFFFTILHSWWGYCISVGGFLPILGRAGRSHWIPKQSDSTEPLYFSCCYRHFRVLLLRTCCLSKYLQFNGTAKPVPCFPSNNVNLLIDSTLPYFHPTIFVLIKFSLCHLVLYAMQLWCLYLIVCWYCLDGILGFRRFSRFSVYPEFA